MAARQCLGIHDMGRIALLDFVGSRIAIAADTASRTPQQQRRDINLAAGLEILGIHV